MTILISRCTGLLGKRSHDATLLVAGEEGPVQKWPPWKEDFPSSSCQSGKQNWLKVGHFCEYFITVLDLIMSGTWRNNSHRVQWRFQLFFMELDMEFCWRCWVLFMWARHEDHHPLSLFVLILENHYSVYHLIIFRKLVLQIIHHLLLSNKGCGWIASMTSEEEMHLLWQTCYDEPGRWLFWIFTRKVYLYHLFTVILRAADYSYLLRWYLLID